MDIVDWSEVPPSDLRAVLAQLGGEEYLDLAFRCVRTGHRGLVARTEDGVVAGFLLGSFVDLGIPHEGGGYVDLLVVDEAHRGSGVGASLVARWKEWLRGEGLHVGFVATTEELGASGFYEHCGFSRCVGPWLAWTDFTRDGEASAFEDRSPSPG